MPTWLLYMYLLNVPSVSSGYFNKIKRKSYYGKQPAFSLEILSVCVFIQVCYLYVHAKNTLKKLCLCTGLTEPPLLAFTHMRQVPQHFND